MSNLSLFLKKNKRIRNNAFYAATTSIQDEHGEPVKWEIRPVTTEEAERIRAICTHEIPVPGKKGMTRDKVDVNEYLDKLTVAAVVFPDLMNAELQDSYGVKTPEELLKQMVDNPAEYADLQQFVQNHSGFDSDMTAQVEEAKN
jgi:hypothetical protein